VSRVVFFSQAPYLHLASRTLIFVIDSMSVNKAFIGLYA
jgi:hypothetical protein